MEFGLSEEQKLLCESVRRFAEDASPLGKVREFAKDTSQNEEGFWKGLAELGVAGILVPEEFGGAGMGLLDAILVQEIIGRQLASSPYMTTAVLAPLMLGKAANQGQKENYLPKISSGEITVGVAISEAIDKRKSFGIVSDASDSAEGSNNAESSAKASGKAIFALGGSNVDYFIVLVNSTKLGIVAANDAGLKITELVTIDKSRSFVELELNGCEIEILDNSNEVVIEQLVDVTRLALAAESLGASQVMLEKAVEYSLERKQFGRVIGSYQAVKHMCAEMVSELEPCRALVWYSSHAYDAVPEDFPLMASHAKALISDVSRDVASTATQVFGGMGFTDLMGLHFWFKRVEMNRQLLGGPELVRERAAKLQGWV